MFRELMSRARAAVTNQRPPSRQQHRAAARIAAKEEARKPSPPNLFGRARRRQRGPKHSRVGPQIQRPGKRPTDPPELHLWHTTQPRPWTKKATNRRRNKAAAASRRRNRSIR